MQVNLMLREIGQCLRTYAFLAEGVQSYVSYRGVSPLFWVPETPKRVCVHVCMCLGAHQHAVYTLK